MDSYFEPGGLKPAPDKSEYTLEIPIPHELKLNQSERKIRGHQLFAWNPTEGTIKVVKYAEVTLHQDLTQPKYTATIHHKVHQDPKLVYLQALNLENATKKVIKMAAQIKLNWLRANQLTNR